MDLIEFIENDINSKLIVDNIDFESIEVYIFLNDQFEKTNVNENYLFQFVYRSFYRLDNAGLPLNLKKEYFNVFQNIKINKDIDVKGILLKLYEFPLLNGKIKNSFQFSFVTKMLNLIDKEIPIYDSEVEKMFNWKRPYINKFDEKFKIYTDRLCEIKLKYNQIIENDLLSKTSIKFDDKFKNYNLNEYKKLDFIVWSAGKIRARQEKQSTKIHNL